MIRIELAFEQYPLLKVVQDGVKRNNQLSFFAVVIVLVLPVHPLARTFVR